MRRGIAQYKQEKAKGSDDVTGSVIPVQNKQIMHPIAPASS